MALTLVEAAKLNSGDVVRSAVIEQFARSSDVLQALPLLDIEGNAYRYNREQTLPGIAFRGVNESFTESTGVINPLTEPLVIGGGDLDVDRFIVNTQGVRQRAVHTNMKIKSLALRITETFIKGDAQTQPREFDGLQVRLTGSQLINAGNTDGGDALSLVKLDEAIDAVDEPTHVLMNKTMRRRLTAAARDTTVGGFISYSQDAFGRKVTQYNDLPILIIDKDETDTDILGFTEVGSGGATATATSIYVVSFTEGKLTGIQNGTMDVRDLGELQSSPVFRTRVEWYLGMVLLHSRAASRLRGISNAAVVK